MIYNSVDPEEIGKFEKLAEEWWDPEGKLKTLHQLNPTRLSYIKDCIHNHYQVPYSTNPLQNLSILDVGCGGGLLAEPLCRLGADVTAIDASSKNINIATTHAKKMNLQINYRCEKIENMHDEKFDIVLVMEVVEHVQELENFIRDCIRCVKIGGLILIATLNRTLQSFLYAIIGAEYILHWLPIGTHQWKKFVKPSEIVQFFDNENIKLMDMMGVKFDLLHRNWVLSKSLKVNYMILGTKY